MTNWAKTNEAYPTQEGWFLVVASGHGKTYQKIDFWDVDDMQWLSEYEDDEVQITHFMPSPAMPSNTK